MSETRRAGVGAGHGAGGGCAFASMNYVWQVNIVK
jgi:hypothetical protein